MNIRKKELLDDFVKKHADARNAFQRWIDMVEKADWKSHADLKIDFPSADYIGNGRYVFNIRGNNYRLAVVVTFIANSLTVAFIGTHGEYDKIDCRIIKINNRNDD
jgi:mRNA interferase HigB